MKNFFTTLFGSWGGDTPQEAIWAANDLLKWAKSKGFQTNRVFIDYAFEGNNADQDNNEILMSELSKFFEDNINFKKTNTISFPPEEELTDEKCPECGSPIIAKMSGIKCSKCNYWFCY